VILFIALPEAKDNAEPGCRAGVIPLELLPRRCPVCRDNTIIGHGRRLRQGHDDQRAWIWVRRGICRPCRKMFTILPDGLLPYGAGDSAEQAVPDCQDLSRSPDPSTVRRWAHRRLHSVWCWAQAVVPVLHFLRTPTILAWDLSALCRILPLEAKSP